MNIQVTRCWGFGSRGKAESLGEYCRIWVLLKGAYKFWVLRMCVEILCCIRKIEQSYKKDKGIEGLFVNMKGAGACLVISVHQSSYI